MEIKLCKKVCCMGFLVLSILLMVIPGKCVEAEDEVQEKIQANLTKSSPGSSPGLGTETQNNKQNKPEATRHNPDAADQAHPKKDEMKASFPEKKASSEEEELSKKKDNEDVVAHAGSENELNHKPESRANLTESGPSPVLGIFGKRPFFSVGQQHEEEEKVEEKEVEAPRESGVAPEISPKSPFVKSTSPMSEESMHEHVERYQLHQADEDDSEEELGLGLRKQPALKGKLSQPNRLQGHAVVVSSESVPVRVGPNTRLGVNLNRDPNVASVGGVRKPLPVVRREQQEHPLNANNGQFQ